MNLNTRKIHWGSRNIMVAFAVDDWKGIGHEETFSVQGKSFTIAIMVTI